MRELVVHYDAHCKLCSWSVRWIRRNDVHKRFSFKALQAMDHSLEMGKQGASEDSVEDDDPFETVVLMLKEKRYERSSAVLRIALHLRFPWPLLGIFFLVPVRIRDSLYDLVARNRKRWFGEACVL